MYRGAVVTLRVVLDQKLPVAVHLVDDLARALEVGEVIEGGALVDRVERFGQRWSLAGEVNEEKSLPGIYPDPMQRIIRLIESP